MALLDSVTSRIKNYFEPTTNVRIRDFVRELGAEGKDWFIETPFRAAASIGAEIGNIGRKNRVEKAPVPKFLQSVLGNEPVTPFGSMKRTTGTTSFLQKHGVPKSLATPLGYGVGLGLTVAEADPRLGLSSFGKKVPKSFVSKFGKGIGKLAQEQLDDFAKFSRKGVRYAVTSEKIKNITNIPDIAGIDESQVQRAMQAIRNGSFRPVIVDAKNNLLDGRHRLEAARRLGLSADEAIPVIRETKMNTLRDAGKFAGSQRALYGAIAGVQQDPNTGNITFDPLKGAAGLALTAGLTKVIKPSQLAKLTEAEQHLQQHVTNAAKEPFLQKVLSAPGNIIAELKSSLVDSFSPINDAIRKSGVKLAATEDPRLLRNVVLGSGGKAQAMLQDGLEPILQKIGPKNIDRFNQYLAARHAIDLHGKNLETGINPELAKDFVQQYGGQFEEHAQQITAYSQHLLKYVQKAGLISEDTYKLLLNKYPNYVPMNRVFDTIQETTGVGSRAVGSLSRQSIVKKIKGSTREIVPPLESLIGRTYQAVKEAEINRVAQSIANLRKLDEFKDLIKPLGVKKVSEETFSEGGKTFTRIVTKREGIPEGMGAISVLENGKKVTYAVPKELEDAAKNLGVQSMNILSRILSVPVRIARLGITGVNLPFILSNVVRDQQTALLTSDKAFRTSILNPYNFSASLFDVLRRGEEYKNFLRSGAGQSAFYQLARPERATAIKDLASSPASRTLKRITNPTQWLSLMEDLVSLGEQTTRVQQFRGTRRALGASGKLDVFSPPDAATLQAVKAGRENTVDFAKKGSWGNVLNSVFIYLNAGIQGSRLLAKSFRDRPAATTFKVATSLYTPVAITTMWNLATPERRQAYMDIPEYERQNNLIILPPNPQKDEKGNYVHAYKIPLPQGFSALAVPVRAAIEHMSGVDQNSIPQALADMAGGAMPINISSKGEVLARVTPTAILPLIENYTNTKLFSGQKLVPGSLENVPVEEQTKKGTSGFIAKIGKAAHLSPIKLQNFIEDYSGGVGLQVLNVIDNALAKAGVIGKNQVGGRDLSEDIQYRFLRARTGRTQDEQYNTIQKLNEQADLRSYKEKFAAEQIYEDLQNIPRSQWKEKLKDLKQNNILTPTLYNRIQQLDKDAQANVTSAEKNARELPIQERSTYILQELQRVDPDGQKEYLKNLKAKGILTRSVFEQMEKDGYRLP